ncbi:MAG: hypothetical protein ACW98D_00335 [Promethearchaeota archaeon]
MGIKFKVLSASSKIPDISSLLLTTAGEVHNFRDNHKKLKILTYSESENFDYFILKVLAAYRIDYKEFYSDLIFSIDPGLKQIGLVVFLDDYYLFSHTIYKGSKLIDLIKNYIECFQINNPDKLNLTFKFGSGVIALTLKLIEQIIDAFQSRNSMKIYLIDESKSSKIRIQHIKKKFRTKHELSALIIALRKGVDIKDLNLEESPKLGKIFDLNYSRQNEKFIKLVNESTVEVKDIIDKILNDKISLSQSFRLINRKRII